MRKSRAITLTVLAGLMLTGCCLTSAGCGKNREQAQAYEPPDATWYDAAGNPVPEKWKTDANGNRVLDAEGRPVPEPGVPYDRQHRPWVFTNGVWAPVPVPIVRSSGSSSSGSSSRSGLWLLGGSGYRSTTSGTSYRSGSGTGSSSIGSSSSPSSISRGGFGSTGSSSSSSSSS